MTSEQFARTAVLIGAYRASLDCGELNWTAVDVERLTSVAELLLAEVEAYHQAMRSVVEQLAAVNDQHTVPPLTVPPNRDAPLPPVELPRLPEREDWADPHGIERPLRIAEVWQYVTLPSLRSVS